MNPFSRSLPHLPALPMTQRMALWRTRTFDFSPLHSRLHVIARLVQRLRPSPCQLLDVGCGPASLRELVSPDVEYFGIDVVPDVISTQDDPTHFAVADLEAADTCFSGRRFDIVVCSGIFEYIATRDRFITFLRRALAPGGHLILSFTNHAHYLDVVKHKQYRDPHVNFMSIANLVRLLSTSGFRVLDQTALTVSGAELPLVRRWTAFPFRLINRQYVFACRASTSGA